MFQLCFLSFIIIVKFLFFYLSSGNASIFILSCLKHAIITLSIGTDRPEQSVAPDQMPHSVASDQGLHCLQLIQQFLDRSTGSKLDLFKF